MGRPELTDSRVAFNGGGWVDVGGKPQRLWCESFWLDRVLDTDVAYVELPGEPPDLLGPAPDERGWYFESCKTRQQPYDLAVTASLVRFAHRFPEGVEISSDGGPQDWQPAMDLCRKVFGHAELPFAGRGAPAPAAEPGRINELLAKRDGGMLAPHEVGELRELLERDLEAGEVPDAVAEPARQPDQPECAP